jgi:hypothetical protein
MATAFIAQKNLTNEIVVVIDEAKGKPSNK